MFAAGITLEEKNWPPFFPIIHHDIANEIPIHLQRLQYVAFTTFLGMFNFRLLCAVLCSHFRWHANLCTRVNPYAEMG